MQIMFTCAMHKDMREPARKFYMSIIQQPELVPVYEMSKMEFINSITDPDLQDLAYQTSFLSIMRDERRRTVNINF